MEMIKVSLSKIETNISSKDVDLSKISFEDWILNYCNWFPKEVCH